MLKLFRTLRSFSEPSFYNLKQFKCVTTRDIMENTYISKLYFKDENAPEDDDNLVSRISYSTVSGQIGLIMVDPEYQNKGLGKQMIIDACHEIESEEVWLVTCPNHPFYTNVFNGAFQFRNPAHKIVWGPGYCASRKTILANSK